MDEHKDLRSMVEEIHKALVGDVYREEGLIKKVDRHDKRLKSHDNYIYGIIGAYFLLIFILKYGKTLIELIS